MENEIIKYRKEIEEIENKYNMQFREFESNIFDKKEDEVEWKDYFEWKTLLNKKRILIREVRIIENRKNHQIDIN